MSDIQVKRKEWSQGAFIEIHDPDAEENPAAVLPEEDAREIAEQIQEVLDP